MDNKIESYFFGVNRHLVYFAMVAIAVGGAIAYAVGEIGLLSLFAIPGILIFVLTTGQPALGLIAYIFITYTQFSNIAIKFHGFPSILQPLAGLLFLIILIRIVLYGEYPFPLGRAGFFIGLCVLNWFVSVIIASDFSEASKTFIGFIKDALGAVIVIYFIRKPSTLRQAIWTLIYAGLLMGSISSFQYLTRDFDNIYWGFGGWENQTSGVISRTRMTGPYSDPNNYAQILIVILPLAVDRLWHEKRYLLRLLAFAAVGVCVLTVFFTYSRGGFLNLLFTLGFLVLERRPSLVLLTVTMIIGLILIQFLPTTYIDRIYTLGQLSPLGSSRIQDPSFQGRISEDAVALRMFLDHPIFGVGLGNYKINYQEYSRELGMDNRREQRTPAGLYSELLSEQGLVGFTIFIVMIYVIVRQVRLAQNKFIMAGYLDEANMAGAFFAGLLGYVLIAAINNSSYANVFWVIIGLAIATSQVATVAVEVRK